MNGANLICESLRELGVSHVFGLPGTQNVLLYEALRTRGMRSIVASDEGAAAFMAAGYARASGRVGVLTTIPGPGFVYALAGIVEAQHDSVPLLWLTLRQADNGRAFQLQQIDQAAMAKPVVKRCMLVDRTDELAQAHGRINEDDAYKTNRRNIINSAEKETATNKYKFLKQTNTPLLFCTRRTSLKYADI